MMLFLVSQWMEWLDRTLLNPGKAQKPIQHNQMVFLIISLKNRVKNQDFLELISLYQQMLNHHLSPNLKRIPDKQP
jgi:hypothetical protein